MSDENAPAVRAKFIGGSDAAAVLGASRWKTPLRVYLEKRGEIVPSSEIDPGRELAMRRGKRMEPVIIDTLSDEYSVKIVRRSLPGKPNRHFDASYPFLGAEVDFEWEVSADDADRWNIERELIGTIQNGEAKSAHQFTASQFGDEETDEIPIEYFTQGMHGLSVRGHDRKLTLFAVMIGVHLVIYWVRRDDLMIAQMRTRLARFWYENVLAGVPPPPINLPDVLLLFKRKEGLVIPATNEVAKLVEQMIEARNIAEQAKFRAEDLKFEIGKFMLGEEAVTVDHESRVRPTPKTAPGRHVLTWQGLPLMTVTLQQSERLDSDLIRRDFPEAARAAAKTSTSLVFRRPKEKK